MVYICACLGLQGYNSNINMNSKDLLNAKEKKRKTQNLKTKTNLDIKKITYENGE